MKGMSKGIGPKRLGSPNKMMKKAPMKVMDEKSMAKIMKKSPLEIGMDKKKMK